MLKACVKKKTRLKLINLKVTEADEKLMRANAKKHANGNLSAWLRYCGTQLTPRRKDVTRPKKAA